MYVHTIQDKCFFLCETILKNISWCYHTQKTMLSGSNANPTDLWEVNCMTILTLDGRYIEEKSDEENHEKYEMMILGENNRRKHFKLESQFE